MAKKEGLSAKRACDRCTAIKPNGDQCERITCKVGPMCWQHTWIHYHVLVKPSKHGMGLFANKKGAKKSEVVFKAGDFVCFYAVGKPTEDTYSEDDVMEYGFEVKKVTTGTGRNKVTKKMVYNSYKTNDFPGRYANDCNDIKNGGRYSNSCSNAKIVAPHIGKNKGTAYIKATKDIKQGQEITVTYGAGYWGLE